MSRSLALLFILIVELHCQISETEIHEIEPRPNIVIFYVDDQGYNDLGCYDSPQILTPNIDKLASEGVRLTNFYTAQPVCTASRVSLLTGCYPNRLGLHGALGPNSGVGIHKEETTIAEMLKLEGYATGIFGKWHLGLEPQFNPLNHGFDEYYGIPYSNDMWPMHPWQGSVFDFPPLPLYDGMKVIDTLEDQSFLTSAITDRSVSFIQKHKDEPFFLYVPHPQPHVPLFVSDQFEGKSERGLYGDVIMEIDWSVGRIMATLDSLGLSDKTLVMYSSDNGPWLSYGSHSGSAYPLREGKGTNWEGGTRVPCVIRYPDGLSAGETIDDPIMTIDILPTITNLIGGTQPQKLIDGKDVWNILSGSSDQHPQEAYYFYYHVNQLQAVRSGHHKLILPHRYRTLNGRTGGNDGLPVDYEHFEVKKAELYNLLTDPEETNNIAQSNPAILKSLEALAQKMRNRLGDSLIGVEGLENRQPGKVME